MGVLCGGWLNINVSWKGRWSKKYNLKQLHTINSIVHVSTQSIMYKSNITIYRTLISYTYVAHTQEATYL